MTQNSIDSNNGDSKLTLTLMPEWAEQEAVILAWPHANSDWAPWLDEARGTYQTLIEAINTSGCVVVLLCHEEDIGLVRSIIPYNAHLIIVPAKYNDTWTRDYAFVTCEAKSRNVAVNFKFNAWGQKFDATLDNEVNASYLAPLCQRKMLHVDFVLEGGAVEIDQNQHLLSTRSCLFNPKRNGKADEQTYAPYFSSLLGASVTTLIANGHLEGDDTDGHIDTLARFTPLHGLVVQSSFNRPDDEHFAPLFKLKHECEQALPSHTIYELPLPLIINQDGQRLPASYANFLICNRRILFPIYNQKEDEEALEVIAKAFPNHYIVPIDCSVLVQQFGSLHCITMQVPTNTLQTDLLARAREGVFVYEDKKHG